MKTKLKKVAVILLSCAMLFSFAACKSEEKEPEVASIMKTIRSQIDLPDMAEIPKEALDATISIPAEDVTELAYVAAGSGATADEILIAKLSDTAVKEDVIKAIEARRTMQADLFKDYNPGEMDKIDNAIIISKNSYVFFAICNDNEKAKKIFNDSF